MLIFFSQQKIIAQFYLSKIPFSQKNLKLNIKATVSSKNQESIESFKDNNLNIEIPVKFETDLKFTG